MSKPVSVTMLTAEPSELRAKVFYNHNAGDERIIFEYKALSGVDPKLDKLLRKLTDYILSRCPDINWEGDE